MKKFLVLGLLLTACGAEEEEKIDPSNCPGNYCIANISVNPLSLSVDGESYVDSESWYTYQLEKLEMEVEQKYPSLKPRIVGSIGLTDLANGLTYFVYNEGYSQQSAYGSMFLLDSSFKNQHFNVLAVKRVNIELLDSNNQVQNTWCFNFKGTSGFVADDKVYSNIKDWTTSITKYKCQIVDGKTFNLPQ